MKHLRFKIRLIIHSFGNDLFMLERVLFIFLFIWCFVSPVLGQPFITIWKSDNSGVTNSDQIRIPGTGTSYLIEWEEVGNPTNNGSLTGSNTVTVTFPSAGTFRIKVYSPFRAISFSGAPSVSGDKLKLLEIEQWGSIAWTGLNFYDCTNLTYSASDVPNLTSVTSLQWVFRRCSNFDGDLSGWNISNVTNLSYAFEGASSFNGDVSTWNTSNVTDMSYTFGWAFSFNGDLSSWNTGSVTNFTSTFDQALIFNQDIGGWNVGSATTMQYMLAGAKQFNQDIGGWDVSKVTNFSYMFNVALAFNQDISSWNTSSGTDFRNMFMTAQSFNQDISIWNTSLATRMDWMFYGAFSFNQNLAPWNIGNVINMTHMLSGSALTLSNYDSTLIGWEAQTVKSNVPLGSVGLEYCYAEPERQALIDDHNWTITGDALQCACAGDPNGIVTWNGSFGDDWADCRNWTPDVIPTSNSNVIVPTGNDVVIYVGTTANCYDVEFQGNSTLTIQDDPSTVLQVHKP